MNKIMDTAKGKLEIAVYPKNLHTTGNFDGGRITEIKPIPFPHEGPAIKNKGPLFYWAWASASGYGKIGLHPHQGFEIISYALEGEIGHYDTLGNESRVRAGGAQVMQTASGVSHQEETNGDRTEFFQIWFEPDVRKTLRQQPTYQAFDDGDFPVNNHEGTKIKTVLGKDSPVILETDVQMQDVLVPLGSAYELSIDRGKSVALLAVKGSALIFDKSTGSKVELQQKDLALIHAQDGGGLTIQAVDDEDFRFVSITAPAKVDYPLYRDGI